MCLSIPHLCLRRRKQCLGCFSHCQSPEHLRPPHHLCAIDCPLLLQSVSGPVLKSLLTRKCSELGSTLLQVHWNLNGNWLLSASRDSLCKVGGCNHLKDQKQPL